MPRLSMPGDMPNEVLVAIETMGNNVRTEILRQVSERGLTALELADRIGVHPASIHRNLIVLERHGLVVADVAPGRRRGQSVRWRTQTEQVAEFARTWVQYACSSADSTT
jgi:DNA-binding transcriptional ArsR family regulator